MAAELKAEFEAFVVESRAAIAQIKATGTYPTADYTATLETRLKEMEATLAKTITTAEAATVTSASVQAQYQTLEAV